jgi:DNA-binding HxlR family transcriptional regulator
MINLITQATSSPSSLCPLEDLFTLLSGPWTCLIIWHLSQNTSLRFLKLKALVGNISAKILTERLRMLENAGMLERTVLGGVPPQVNYCLSARGQELRHAFSAMQAIAEQWGPIHVRKSRNKRAVTKNAPIKQKD